MRVTPQNPVQFHYWGRMIDEVRRSQMTHGTGMLFEVDFPNFEVLMPKLTNKQEVRENGKKGNTKR